MRMVIATGFVLALTAASSTLGPRLSGLISPFPIFGVVLAAFSHRMAGADAAARVMRGMVIGSIGFAGFFIIVAYVLPVWPIGWTYLLATGVALGINGVSLRVAAGMTALIDLLSERAQEDGTWAIAPEEVAGLLGIDMVRFWRAVHDVQDRIALSDAIDGWTQETVGELVPSWSACSERAPKTRYTGRALPAVHARDRADRRAHVPRAADGRGPRAAGEELAAMVRHHGAVRAAIEIYLDEYTDVNALVDGSAESFRVLRGLPPRGRETARLRVVQAQLSAKPPLSLLFAIPDHPWVDTAEGAAVRIAMTVGAVGDHLGELLEVTEEEPQPDGSEKVSFKTQRGRISADLTIGADVSSAVSLKANDELSCPA